MSPADVYLRAIDAMSVALEAPSQDAAIDAVKVALADLVDADELRRVATCLAVTAAREMPPLDGRAVRSRRRWLVRYRLEVAWAGDGE